MKTGWIALAALLAATATAAPAQQSSIGAVPQVGTTVPLSPGQDVTGMPLPEQGATVPQAPGQDVTGTPPPEQGATVPQARFEPTPLEPTPLERTRLEPAPQAGPEAESQPRFVRAPGESGIETTPLAPPVGAEPLQVFRPDPARESATEVNEGEALLQPEVGAEGATEERQGEALSQPRFKAAPEPSLASLPDANAVPIDAPSTDLRGGVRLRELDKMTGQTETFELAVGEERQIDRLKVKLEACRSPQTNDTHGTMAFLKVWDIRSPDEEAFSGWMFAEAPSLSALDHPRYDLWVISCTTS